MQTTIKKCDRCKQITDGLINIEVVNTTVEKSEGFKEKELSQSGLVFFGTPRPQHPTIKWEMCEDCTKQLIRWSGHTENQLIGETK
jgi:phage FluMu protein Com